MSLTIHVSQDEQIVGEALRRLVRDGIAQGGLVVLAPTFAEVLRVQKDLANEGLSLGVEVSTPRAWVRDRWDVWGDGRRVADDSARSLLMSRVLEQAADQPGPVLPQTSGMVRLLSALAERALPWLDAALDEHGDALTPAERRAVQLLDVYQELLSQHDLVEGATCACLLPEAMASAGVVVPPVVLVGFDDLSQADRELTCGLSQITDVTYVVRAAPTLCPELAMSSVHQLAQKAAARGVAVDHTKSVPEPAPNPTPARDPELDALLRALFAKDAEPVEPAGAVRLLQASGPLAEAELVAREVAGLAADGMRSAVVVVPDVARAWRELAPKLVAHGISVRAQLSTAPLKTESGRAFASYVATVARLVELDKSWPAPRQGADGAYVSVGDMSWWPPSALVDFLLCDIAHTVPAKVRRLDIAWRGDRLLSPANVLEQLQSAKLTSDAVERATRELLRGRIGSAASKLLAPYVTNGAGGVGVTPDHVTSLAHEEATAVLAAFLSVASTLKELGMTADPQAAASVSLAELAQAAELALDNQRIMLRPEARAKDERARVIITDRRSAATLSPASFDAAVLCGLTSTEFPVPAAQGELDGMLHDLQIEVDDDALPAQRALFSKLCALPTRKLLLEWALFSADAKENYLAVMPTELLSCYAQTPPTVRLTEDHVRANLSARGVAPVQLEQEQVAPAGNIHASLRRLVTVPQEGCAELPGGLPVLSASQLESYLECPLKWFSLRRLRLGDNDAGFGPMEMGTFAHRVLELTYAQLFEEGRAALDPHNADGMARAHAVLDEHFRVHREHQHMRAGSKAAYQALIPHTAQDESSLERLHRDLSSTLDYTAHRLVGYEPKAFEWEFGRGEHTSAQEGLPSLPAATYAGVGVTGTVDRIDINAHGQAVIIDYKHKGPAGFFAEYAAFGRDGATQEFVLPRRIQALLYAQVVRRAFPDLRVVGALYLGTRGTHELSGAVSEDQADAVFGGNLGPRRAKQVVVGRHQAFALADQEGLEAPPDATSQAVVQPNPDGQPAPAGMDAFLDATEEAIARKVDRLREGHIEAEPIDAAACSFCPVTNCERRL